MDVLTWMTGIVYSLVICIGEVCCQSTIVMTLEETVAKDNHRISTILENINKYSDEKGPLADINFEVVIVGRNGSTNLDSLDKVCDIVKSGIIAIMDMSSPNLAPLMRSFARTLGIAYISLVDISYYRYVTTYDDHNTLFEVEPTSFEMMHVVADIVRQESLNNVAIAYDSTFDIQNTPRRVLTNVPAQHLYVHISEWTNETQKQIKMLNDIEIKNIFFISSVDRVKHVLKVVSAMQLQNFDVNMFILTKDPVLICTYCLKNGHLVFIWARTEEVMSESYINFMKFKVGINSFGFDRIKVDEAMVFDLTRLIRRAVANMSELHPIKYPDCYDDSLTANETDLLQSSRLITVLRELREDGVFGSLIHERGGLGYNFTLQLSTNVYENGVRKSSDVVGKWTDGRGLDLVSGKRLIKSNKKQHYRVVTVANSPPFVYKTDKGNGTAEYYGYCIDLLRRISEILDFTYDIYDTELYGAMSDDGSWNGLIQELISKKADIGVGPLSVMAERENVVDFTVPYYDLVGLTILMKKPKFDYSLVKFLSVLDEDVWGCIIGAFFLFSVLISVFDKLSPFSYQNNKQEQTNEGPESRVFTLKEGIWFCMMSLTPQGGGETPRALSGRLIAATWWLFGFIIIATYTANLAAFLTVSRLVTQVKSLDDLSKQFKVKYAPMNGSNAQIYFKRMADIENRFYGLWKDMSLDDTLNVVERAKLAVWDYPVSDKYTKLWETMKTSDFPNNEMEAKDRVLKSEFAFISDATSNKYATLTNCDLWEVGEEFSRKPYALAVQEGSPLRSQLSNVILQLINQRELEEFKTKWWSKDRLQCPDVEDESDGISIKNIGGVFLVIAIGSGLALITLALECYWYSYKPQKRKKLYACASQAQLTANVSTVSLANGPTSNEAVVNGRVGTKDMDGKDGGHGNGGLYELVERL
ncbi:ionotropic receptor 25a-like [Gigantopelta aegis]|uniref:ionotropic receptor 25a-like n=1 Tax=Gigantopelta aegis TaxID=1735272 RepID=UPI001B88B756|nr:ionotropic receptor 25a-like [Gigantopelta aegis]